MTEIPITRLRELKRAEAKLQALEAGGVDNWEGYEEALTDYNGGTKLETELEEYIEKLYEKIEYEISLGVDELAGAGYGIKSKNSEKALGILKTGIEAILLTDHLMIKKKGVLCIKGYYV